MDLKTLDILLEKFYDGQTTEDEELRLKTYFAGNDVPEKYANEQAYFDFIKKSKEATILPEGFHDEVEKLIEKQNTKVVPLKKYLHTVLAIAASVIFVVYLAVFFQSDSEKMAKTETKDTFDNPREAYEATKKALMLISNNMNKGAEKLESLEVLDKSMTEMKKLENFNKGTGKLKELKSFEKGVKDLGSIAMFNEYQQMIKSKAAK